MKRSGLCFVNNSVDRIDTLLLTLFLVAAPRTCSLTNRPLAYKE